MSVYLIFSVYKLSVVSTVFAARWYM